jgi:hypothetical protein
MQQLGGSIGVAGLTTVFAAVTVSGGEARGIAAALLGGTAFLTVGLVLFAVWGRRAPAVGSTDASTSRSVTAADAASGGPLVVTGAVPAVVLAD